MPARSARAAVLLVGLGWLVGVAACGAIEREGGRAARGIVALDQPRAVPPPPERGGEEPPPLVALFVFPGVDPDLAAAAVRRGAAPGVRRLRLEGTATPLSGRSLALALADPESQVRRALAPLRIAVLRSSAPIERPPPTWSVLRAGAVKDLTEGRVTYVRLLEDPSAPPDAPPLATPAGGVVFRRSAATGGAAGDVFHLTLPGPPGPEGAPRDCPVTVLAHPARTQVSLRTPDDRIEIGAGDVSRPVVCRFGEKEGLPLFGRVRFVLSGAGDGRLDLYATPPDPDPLAPLDGAPLAEPPAFLESLARLPGPLPRLAPLDFGAALREGALRPQEALRLAEAEYERERALFDALLARGELDGLFVESPLAERLRAVAAAVEPDRTLAVFGQRVRAERLPLAAFSRLDRMVGAALAAGVARRLAVAVEVRADGRAFRYALPRPGGDDPAAALVRVLGGR